MIDERVEQYEVVQVSADELVAQAIAADPNCMVDPHAVPLGEFLRRSGGRSAGPSSAGDLPSWYMPTAQGRGGRRHLAVISVIILALLVVMVFGYCITYGSLVIA